MERKLFDFPDMGGVFGHVDYEHYVDDLHSGCEGCETLRQKLREAQDRDEERKEN